MVSGSFYSPILTPKSYGRNICIIDDVGGIVKWGGRKKRDWFAALVTLLEYGSKIGTKNGKINRVKLLNDMKGKYRINLGRLSIFDNGLRENCH